MLQDDAVQVISQGGQAAGTYRATINTAILPDGYIYSHGKWRCDYYPSLGNSALEIVDITLKPVSSKSGTGFHCRRFMAIFAQTYI